MRRYDFSHKHAHDARATPSQVQFLVSLGVDPRRAASLTKDQATTEITARQMRQRRDRKHGKSKPAAPGTDRGPGPGLEGR